MSKRQIILTVILASFFAVAIMAASMLFFRRAMAAPPARVASTTTSQITMGNPTFVSLSSLAFMPLNPNTLYRKDAGRQLLALESQTRNFTANNNIFVAPLALADKSVLTGITVFGEDFDNQGAVWVRLKRCDHGQARCVSLIELSSTDSYALGQFETIKITIPNELVDNNFYSYFLELELTALANSGLRSVRLEIIDGEGSVLSPDNVESWSLSGSVRTFPLPNQNWTQVRVCTDDLSHLNNATHYPILVLDGQSIRLFSNSCLTEWGRDIEIRRELNTGPSSGSYQFLR